VGVVLASITNSLKVGKFKPGMTTTDLVSLKLVKYRLPNGCGLTRRVSRWAKADRSHVGNFVPFGTRSVRLSVSLSKGGKVELPLFYLVAADFPTGTRV